MMVSLSKLRHGFILVSEAGVRASVQFISPPIAVIARQASPVVRPAYWTSDE